MHHHQLAARKKTLCEHRVHSHSHSHPANLAIVPSEPDIAQRLVGIGKGLPRLPAGRCFETDVSQTDRLPLEPQPLTALERVVTCRYHGQPQHDWQASNPMKNAEPLESRGVLTSDS
jgi:hypothetical protein